MAAVDDVPDDVLFDFAPARLGLHCLLDDVVSVAVDDTVHLVVRVGLLYFCFLFSVVQQRQLVLILLLLLRVLLRK